MLIKIKNKIFKAKMIIENKKKKYIVNNLGNFFENEISFPDIVERFLWHIRKN